MPGTTPKLPYETVVTYEDGSTGTFSHWAHDMKHALELLRYWLPEHKKAVGLQMTIRGVQPKGERDGRSEDQRGERGRRTADE